MSFALVLLSGILLLVGLIGCVLPILPGPVVAFCGLLCLLPTDKSPSAMTVALFGVATIVAMVLDSVVPMVSARKFKCSKWGVWGCFVGTLLGAFFFPLGLLLGPFLGAFAGELIAGRAALQAVRGGVGAFLGFLVGTLIKLAVCFAMIVCYVRCL